MTEPATNSRQNSIDFRGVSFRVDGLSGREIVSGVNLTVPHGKTLVLLGRSGSGKTTLLKLINGMLVPGRRRSGSETLNPAMGPYSTASDHRVRDTGSWVVS